jgi:hypothetical protein
MINYKINKLKAYLIQRIISIIITFNRNRMIQKIKIKKLILNMI